MNKKDFQKFVFMYKTLNNNTMKTNVLQIFFVFILTVISVLDVKSQDKLSQTLASIGEKVKDVQIDKTTYKQSIDVLNGDKGKLGFVSVEVDDKGRKTTERFEFYLSDIDPNTILRKTSGKKLFVSLTVNNNQKFIKHFKEDKAAGYDNSLEILSSNADEAQLLADLFKSSIKLVSSGQPKWNTGKEALSWLKSNIGKIDSDPVTFDQSFTYNESKDYLAALTVKKSSQKSAATEEKYEFSIPDLNPKDLKIKVSGTQLSVSLGTKGNEPYISYTKNNEQQNFEKDFELYAEDSDQARNIIAALTAAIEMSRPVLPDFGSLQKSLDFISRNTGEVTLDKKTVTQKLGFTPGDGTKSVFTYIEQDAKGKPVEQKYEFYLCDLDTSSLGFKVSGKKINLVPVTGGRSKLIKYYKDNEVQDLQYDFQILMPDIETSHEMVEAFKAAIKQSEVKPVSWKSVEEAVNFLNGAIKGESIGSDVYKVNLSTISASPMNLRYEQDRTDSKGVTSGLTFEFYPFMLDPATVKVSASGKFLNVEAVVAGKDQFIKVFKDGKQQAFDNNIELMAFDSRQAQGMAEALKFIAGNSTPKMIVWGDKQSAMKFITDNVGEVKTEDKDAKQKLEPADGDPCKVKLTVSTSDDKGKTTEEIYEFGLPDMNDKVVDVKVRGKNVDVILACKTKDKLVKVYKNGSQQAWGSSVEIGLNDVEIARNVAEAFKSLINQCGK